MKVQKFREYLILEGDTPENFMQDCLGKIKKKLDPLFNHNDNPDEVKKMGDFAKFNLQLENDPSVDRYPHVENSLKYKFTDDDKTLYILTITIDLKDALNDKPDSDYRTSDIKKAKIEFQKYITDEQGGLKPDEELMTRTVDPEEIDGDYLIKLKVELDKGKTEEENKEEEFEIQTEEPGNDMPAEETDTEQTPAPPATSNANAQAPAPAPSAAQSGLPK